MVDSLDISALYDLELGYYCKLYGFIEDYQ